MKKRGARMLAMLIVLAVLIGGYFLVTELTADKGVQDLGEGEYTVFDLSKEDIVGLSWTHDDTDIALEYNDKWEVVGDADFPLDEDKITELVSDLAELTATRKLEGELDLSVYGLDEPEFILNVSLSDGRVLKYEAGAENDISQVFYMAVTEDGSTPEVVYALTEGLQTKYDIGQYELLKWEDTPKVGEAQRVVVNSGSDTIVDAVYREDSTDYYFNDSYSWYAYDENEDSPCPMENSAINGLVDNLKNLSWNSCVKYDADEQALEEYGLGSSARSIIVYYTEDENSEVLESGLEIGAEFTEQEDESEVSYYYVRIPDSDMVYTVEGTSIENILNATYSNCRVQTILPLDYDTVNSLKVVYDDKEHEIERELSESVVDGETQLIEEGLKYDGVYSLDEDEFNSIIDNILALTAEEWIAEEIGDREAVLSITMMRDTAEVYKEISINIYEYDANSYIVEAYGAGTALVNADSVDAIVRGFKNLTLSEIDSVQTAGQSTDDVQAEATGTVYQEAN